MREVGDDFRVDPFAETKATVIGAPKAAIYLAH